MLLHKENAVIHLSVSFFAVLVDASTLKTNWTDVDFSVVMVQRAVAHCLVLCHTLLELQRILVSALSVDQWIANMLL